MTKQQEQVKDFMIKAGQNCPDKPTIPDEATRILRIRLELEELLELAEASGVLIYHSNIGHRGKITKIDMKDVSFVCEGEVNLLEVADALTDIDYVNLGAAVAYGIDLDPFQDEVHQNNMSKFFDGYRDENGKWRKGPSYKPVDLKPILEAQLT